MSDEQCREKEFDGVLTWRCARKVYKDGYCKLHYKTSRNRFKSCNTEVKKETPPAAGDVAAREMIMQKNRIIEAKKLAQEFINLVNELEAEENRRVSTNGEYTYDSPKHRGAVRRKSMDLTRSLAEMRKP